MQQFEKDYSQLVLDVLSNGERRSTRNASTSSVFGRTLTIPLNGEGIFPVLQGRKMFFKGILGEFAAMIRKPTHVSDFEKWGCNYWKQWADDEGNLILDYGNAWFESGQIEHLKRCLRNDHTNRRMIVSGWRPERLYELSLPCCHYSYQFYVTNNGRLDMIWTQRSADVMIGIPSNIIFAALWVITLANEFNLDPGTITMNFGDTHIYEDHIPGALKYLAQLKETAQLATPIYAWLAEEGKPFEEFTPDDLLIGYSSAPAIPLELFS